MARHLLAAATLALLVTGCATAPPPAAQDQAPASDPKKTMTLHGQLTGEGVECQAFRADDGTLYTLLGDMKGFKAGDRVTIEAAPVEMSFCMQGVTVAVTRIVRREAPAAPG
jgi:hypothetical protein